MTKETYTRKNKSADVETDRVYGRWVTTVTFYRSYVRKAYSHTVMKVRVFSRRGEGLKAAKEFVK
jgi:hypothetical protein